MSTQVQKLPDPVENIGIGAQEKDRKHCAKIYETNCV